MPWFLCLLLAAFSLLAGWRFKRLFVGVSAAVAFTVGASLLWPGRYYAEKMLTDLALPVGVLWILLVLTLGGAVLLRRWQLAGWSAVLLLVLTTSGHSRVANLLTTSLERPYRTVNPLESGRFDAVFLLGGGSSVDHRGQPKLSSSGDRIAVAARLYRTGQTPVVYCTGNDVPTPPNLPTAAEASADVLVTSFGLPRDALRLAGGENTSTELAVIKRIVDAQGWQRIGVVTSAWHMSRVTRLARKHDVTFIPLPADFRTAAEADLSPWEKFLQFSVIPSAGALEQTHASGKEFLARLAGR